MSQPPAVEAPKHQRQKRYSARMEDAGFLRLQIWVHEDDREKLLNIAADLRAARPVE